MRIISVLAITAVLLLQLTACGGSSDDSSPGAGGETSSGAPAAAEEAPEQAANGSWAVLKRFAGPNADMLIVPRGPSPDHVVIRDLEVGSGPAIEAGDIFLSRYISFDYEDEDVVEPLPEESPKPTWVDAGSLKWGVGERVPGWEPGLKGIRAGGMRELIVPSRLAYENGVRVYLVKVTKIESK